MTGNDLAKAIKNSHGHVQVAVNTPNDTIYIYAVKTDLIGWAKRQGKNETNMTLNVTCGQTFLETENDS